LDVPAHVEHAPGLGVYYLSRREFDVDELQVVPSDVVPYGITEYGYNLGGIIIFLD
jgi:hypothetical protein